MRQLYINERPLRLRLPIIRSFRKYGIGFFLLLLFSIVLNSQTNNIGIPFTTNYPNEVYKGGTQNWDVGQHPNGFLFFANNNGLLQFDGTNWTQFPLANNTIVRSLCITDDGRIYVGGQGDFGYFEPNEQGKLIFHSLLNLIPTPHKKFEDVWDILVFEKNIYFSTEEKVYIYNRKKIEVLSIGKAYFTEKAGNRLFFNNEKGLSELINGEIILVEEGEKLANKEVTSIIEIEQDKLLLTTLHNGLFELIANKIQPIPLESSAFLKKNKIYCATKLANGAIALGTTYAGLLVLNKDKKVPYQLKKQNGLQNNSILSIFKDSANNLWLGLENGIDYVSINAPFTKIIPDKNREGSGYAAQIFEEKLYLGTSSGLYQQPWKTYYNPFQPNDFQLVENSLGQVWGTTKVDESLFLGHHEGGFLLKQDHLNRISPDVGNWKIIQLLQNPAYFLVGTYDGLDLYKKNKQSWQFIKKFEALKKSSCRFMEQDELGNIWVAHPYRGIYKVQLTDDLMEIKVKLYGKTNGFPSDNQNHVFKINKEIIFTGQTGVYQYEAKIDSFIPHAALADIIGPSKSIQRFFEDKTGSIWFVTLEETGVIKVIDKGLEKSFAKIIYPELNKKLVRGFEFIYPYDEHNVFIGAEKGFIHFNPSKTATDKLTNLNPNIVKVVAVNHKDSLLHAGQYNQPTSQINTTFPSDLNAFRFSYTLPHFSAINRIEYATKLEGFDKDWSSWGKKTDKEYTNLDAGTYRFLVKARTNDQDISSTADLSFVINPPWYASIQAIFLYILLALSFLASLIFIPRRRFKKKLIKSKEAHQKVVARSEEEIIALKNKNLETKIIHKNRELALTTMNLVQRNELILKLQEPLQKIMRKTTDKVAIQEIKRINSLLNESANLDENWNQFAHQFDLVHIDFLKRIRQKYPQLTATDHKFCAYLRLNLSTKEIAPLLNISIRGVEAGRYRLRKKLDLDSSVNLNEFMLSI